MSNGVCQSDVDGFESVMNGFNNQSEMCFGTSSYGYDTENEMCVGPSYSGVDDLMAYGFDPSDQQMVDIAQAVMPAVIGLLLADKRTNVPSPVETPLGVIDPVQATLSAVVGLLLNDKPAVQNTDPTKTNPLGRLNSELDLCGRRTNLSLVEYEELHPLEHQFAVDYLTSRQMLSESVMFDAANIEFASYLEDRVNQAYSDGLKGITAGLYDPFGISAGFLATEPTNTFRGIVGSTAAAAFSDINTARTAADFLEDLPGMLEATLRRDIDATLDPAITEELWGDLIDEMRTEWYGE